MWIKTLCMWIDPWHVNWCLFELTSGHVNWYQPVCELIYMIIFSNWPLYYSICKSILLLYVNWFCVYMSDNVGQLMDTTTAPYEPSTFPVRQTHLRCVKSCADILKWSIISAPWTCCGRMCALGRILRWESFPETGVLRGSALGQVLWELL